MSTSQPLCSTLILDIESGQYRGTRSAVGLHSSACLQARFTFVVSPTAPCSVFNLTLLDIVGGVNLGYSFL